MWGIHYTKDTKKGTWTKEKIKASKGRQARWTRAVNHRVSRRIVDFAARYPAGVLLTVKYDRVPGEGVG
jgi:hypothetical protein